MSHRDLLELVSLFWPLIILSRDKSRIWDLLRTNNHPRHFNELPNSIFVSFFYISPFSSFFLFFIPTLLFFSSSISFSLFLLYLSLSALVRRMINSIYAGLTYQFRLKGYLARGHPASFIHRQYTHSWTVPSSGAILPHLYIGSILIAEQFLSQGPSCLIYTWAVYS